MFLHYVLNIIEVLYHEHQSWGLGEGRSQILG